MGKREWSKRDNERRGRRKRRQERGEWDQGGKKRIREISQVREITKEERRIEEIGEVREA